jgi:nucleoid-associated protein YgaU
MHACTPRRRSALVIALLTTLPLLGACGGQSAPVATPIPPAAPSPAASPASSPVVVPASSPEPAASTSGPGQTHTVGEGDTLRSIAQQYYGDGEMWQKIFEANKDTIGADPDSIKIGQSLKIPPKE